MLMVMLTLMCAVVVAAPLSATDAKYASRLSDQKFAAIQ